jgi:phage gpG-like protein
MSNYWRIELEGEEQAKAFFDYAGYKVRDMRDPFHRVKDEVILLGLHVQFNTEGGRTGGWISLNADYEEDKFAKWGYKPILEASGLMKQKLLDPDAFHITQKRLVYSPDAPEYAVAHQTGAERPRGDLPPRPWLVVTFDDEDKIYDIFYEWLDELRHANRRRPNSGVYMGPMPKGWSLI